jgi:hypothetical protein
MSKQSKDALQPFPNLQWTRVSGSEDYFDRADGLRDRFSKLTAILAMMMIALPFLAGWVINRARKPNPIQVYADGRLFTGDISYGTHVSEDADLDQMRDTINVLFSRTEKGGVKALEDFVGPGVMEIIEGSFKASSKMKSGYSQQYSITSLRVLVADPSWAVLGVRGLLSSRTVEGYQPSELFLVAGFRRGTKTDRNMLGWRLIRMLPDPDGVMYYNQELARERAMRLGLDQK